MTPSAQTAVIVVRFRRPTGWEEIRHQDDFYRLAYRVSCGTCYAYLGCKSGEEGDAVSWACQQLEERGVLSANTKVILIIRHGGNMSSQVEWERHSYNYVEKGGSGWRIIEGQGPNRDECQKIWEDVNKFWDSMRKEE